MTAITDKPIQSISEDLLKMEVYSQALANFILSSDTPITIGLQGEWGTGKTSLMSIIQEILTKESTATSWVNTWEYSMFLDSRETTAKVLNGMLEKLELHCRNAGNWDIGDEASQQIKKVSKFLGNIANQVVSKKVGVDLQKAVSGGDDEASEAEIAIIKSEITEIIKKLINSSGNPYKKVVFFVDDLDRIPPADAIEVLEALKNIFDIPHCIFVLAIDYDVVVKGLESKFGKKTHENEREFRSFFDKIIQVPFSMPVGAYDIENFLINKLNHLGIKLNTDKADFYVKAVRHTVGSNPRSLKRYLNSFSLINNVRAMQVSSEDENDDFMLFALLRIQISYPQIFRLLTQNADYPKWDKGFASKFGVDWDEVQLKLEIFGDNELVDEAWEQVIWGFCQKDPYLKSRVFEVLIFLNELREYYKDNLPDEIDKAMEFAAITNVDDDLETKHATQKIGDKVYFDGLESKLSQLIDKGYNPDGIESYRILVSYLENIANSQEYFRMSMANSGGGFYDDRKGRGAKMRTYINNPKKKSAGLLFSINNSRQLVDHSREYISGLLNAVESEHIKMSYKYKNKDTYSLQLFPSLAEAIGVANYHELQQYIAEEIVKDCEKE